MQHNTLDSEWNQAEAVHRRIHFALLACKEAKYNDDYKTWYKGLVDLFCELSSSMTGKTLEEDGKEIKEMWAVIQELKIVNQGDNNYTDALQDKFINAEVRLRVIMRERGLDLPRKKDPGSALQDDRGF